MLKKLRRRFILSVMAAVSAVMLILLLIINIANYSVTTEKLDRSIEMLSEMPESRVPFDGDFDDDDDADDDDLDDDLDDADDYGYPHMMDPEKMGERRWRNPDEQDSFRFFSVFCDSEGNITDKVKNPFFSIEGTDAEFLVPDVLAKEKTSGYYGGYRYLVKETEAGHILSFMDCGIETENMRNLLLVSVFVAAGSLLVIFGLVTALSKRAMDPYIKNIEQQKRFITDAGHELKTPITAIAASADVLAVEHEGDEWVENIQCQTVRLGKLVENLITLSRLDEENPVMEKSEFSLSDAVWEIAEPFASLAKAKGKEYSQNIQDGLTFSGSKESIQQMVSILLDNAVKYSDDNGTIRLDVAKSHRSIVISVFNTCDIPDISELYRVFDRFFRLDKSRSKKTGGTGVGLSIAKAIAEANGGSIKVSSENGKTILFTVTL
ncbi:MAG: HAMP domain-containing histidine kinase [Oscillospiraceae bacterium]|nr:HAMP domain-containing histidine kinase [Oscillospiraceae bacterium]